MNKEYLTVKEFAEAAKISQQAVYKQMSSRLKPYIKIKGNQKMIQAAALEKFYSEDENDSNLEEIQPIQPDSTLHIVVEQPKPEPYIAVEQPNQPKVEQPAADDEKPNIMQHLLEEQIKELQQQMQEIIKSQQEEKKFLYEQIEKKDKQIERKDQQIENLTENLKMAQQLAAADKKKLLELEAKQQEQEIVDADIKQTDPPAAADANNDTAETDQESKSIIEEPKKSFFARLFGR